MTTSNKENYYIEKKSGWFNGTHDHVVKIRDRNDAVLCKSSLHACEAVVLVLTVAAKIRGKL